MDLELLVRIIGGLLVLLVLLIVIFVLPSRAKKKKSSSSLSKTASKVALEPKDLKELSFDELRAIVRKRSSTTKDLEDAIEQIVKSYSKIHPKMGLRTHPDFDMYIDLIVHLVRHKNTNTALVLKLDRALVKNNPDYKAELNDALQKALNSRGF